MKSDICLIFDMDGTLWDATPGLMGVSNSVIEKELGMKEYLTQEKVKSVMGLEIEEIANVYFPQLDRDRKLEIMYKIIENENPYLAKHGGKLFSGVKETLSKLQEKYDLMVVTNGQEGYVQAMYQGNNLGSYFCDYEEFGRTMKPKGENIRLIMERNGYKKAYYIGDTQKDLESCQMAGVPFVYAAYGFGQVDSYDKKIDSFEQLLDIFI